MYNSTKLFIKRKIIQLIGQCDDVSNMNGRVTLDDIRSIIDELETKIVYNKINEVIHGDNDRDFIIKCAKTASSDAVQRAFNKGLFITVLEDNNIVKKYSDGHVEIIK